MTPIIIRSQDSKKATASAEANKTALTITMSKVLSLE